MALALGVSEELGWTASLHDSVMPETRRPTRNDQYRRFFYVRRKNVTGPSSPLDGSYNPLCRYRLKLSEPLGVLKVNGGQKENGLENANTALSQQPKSTTR